ncbi:MAG: phosphoserine phosphatase SerB [Pseudomonadota bacterium]|uniref:Phosphoserine phosphatase n=1 Tax=Methylophaga aminisulfidivorans MP TaxID=1026882 RepID=F5T017_9GAMM|nr:MULTISPECIES: phosphoserine phosphatase SerB [Methylophaga]EGL54853.1 phosphoserine phosphatase [Methylophaga aminisulfidivorans MP]MEC9411288.1 phosphoserine phosphatase SerB [Pseudomonadota bacterium]WVI84448.1 phosphoserine phosphatase SerB [Methylophaga thalassica]
MTTLVLQGKTLTHELAEQIAHQYSGQFNWYKHYVTVTHVSGIDAEAMHQLRQQYDFDINLIPEQFDHRAAKLLVTDMDSTLITIECIDEIADFMNLKPEVAAITESAMRGEIDFETSLRKRVSLLKGLDVEVLERVYDERLRLSPGAELMVSTLKQHGFSLALVSGGFTFFTDRLKQRLGLDFAQANKLAEKDGKLTGEVDGDICGAQTKADFLLSCCDKMNIVAEQTIAVGDGANDLLMMEPAGLSVAYHAKPKVQQQAATAINHNGLDAILGLLQLEYN